MKNEQQAMVEAMKVNKEAFQFWPTEWREWAKKNWKHMVVACDFELWTAKSNELFCSGDCYRLSPDFQLPVERWWYCNEHHALKTRLSNPQECDVEVSPYNLAYVRSVIERKDINLNEWEYRTVKVGDTIITYGRYTEEVALRDSEYLFFVRKPKPEAKVVQKEYSVVKDKLSNNFIVVGFYRIVSERETTLSEAWRYAIDRGMGMEFAFDGYDMWCSVPTIINSDGMPAKCIKVRCWVTE